MNLQQLRFDRDQISDQIQQINLQNAGKNIAQILAAYSTINNLRQQLIQIQKQILLSLSIPERLCPDIKNLDRPAVLITIVAE